MTRKLAYLRTVDDIQPIQGADNIEAAVFGGWIVIIKKDLCIKPGDKMIFCEIDSVFPQLPYYEFMKSFKYRIKTKRLRGVLSQGIAFTPEQFAEAHGWELLCDTAFKKMMGRDELPGIDLNGLACASSEHGTAAIVIDSTPSCEVVITFTADDGFDFTELMGITKYEAPVVDDPSSFGVSAGSFFSDVPKTDEERIQNLDKQLHIWDGLKFNVTEKLDGTSMTVKYRPEDDVLEVAGRNLKRREGDNMYWNAAKAYNLKTVLRTIFEKTGGILAVQGELIGPGIQKNKYKLDHFEFRIFRIFNTVEARFLNDDEVDDICREYKLHRVPYISEITIGGDTTLAYLLKMADGQSALNPDVIREGIVFSTTVDKLFRGSSFTRLSFKAVSNRFLDIYEE